MQNSVVQRARGRDIGEEVSLIILFPALQQFLVFFPELLEII